MPKSLADTVHLAQRVAPATAKPTLGDVTTSANAATINAK